jgi:hypothetical protein
MPKFLIEAPHEGTTQACLKAIELFHRTGSHFLTHADWGCKDGQHTAWIIVETDNREDARRILPVPYRASAKIVQLNAFTGDDLAELLRQHPS